MWGHSVLSRFNYVLCQIQQQIKLIYISWKCEFLSLLLETFQNIMLFLQCGSLPQRCIFVWLVFSRSAALGQHLLYHSFSTYRALLRAKRMHLTAVRLNPRSCSPHGQTPQAPLFNHTKVTGFLSQGGWAGGCEPVCSASTCRLVCWIVSVVTWPLLPPQDKNKSLTLWLEEKKSCVANASPLCFVYSCTSLMNDSLKSHRFSLCPVQGEMSCFYPVACS